MKKHNIRSELQGRIEWLCLCFDGDDRLSYLELLQALLDSLPKHTQLLVCCLRQEYADFLYQKINVNWGGGVSIVESVAIQRDGRCFLWVPDNPEDIGSIWCRDPFLLKQHPTDATILVCKTGYARNNHFLCDALARLHIPGWHLKKETEESCAGLYLSGGNLLADEHFLLVGYHEFKISWQGSRRIGLDALLPDEPTAVQTLLNWANGSRESRFQKIYLVGQNISFPPMDGRWGDKIFAHLDTYLSLTGIRVLDVSGHSRYVVLVAQADRVLLPENAPESRMNELLQNLNVFLDGVARQLSDTGDFEVRRNPIPIFAHCVWDFDNARPHPTRFYPGLLNNVLLQAEEASKIVWLPCLTPAQYLTGTDEYLASTERANIALWTELGYEIRLVRANFHPFWQWMGGLRCMTSDLARNLTPRAQSE